MSNINNESNMINSRKMNPIEEIRPNNENPASESIINQELDWEILNADQSKRHWFKQNYQDLSHLMPAFVTYH